jgi:hypothetical protein
MILKIDVRKYAVVHVVMEVQQKFVTSVTEKKKNTSSIYDSTNS